MTQQQLQKVVRFYDQHVSEEPETSTTTHTTTHTTTVTTTTTPGPQPTPGPHVPTLRETRKVRKLNVPTGHDEPTPGPTPLLYWPAGTASHASETCSPLSSSSHSSVRDWVQAGPNKAAPKG